MKLQIRIFLLLIIFAVGFFYFRAITNLSGAGDVIVGLENQTKDLEKQNRALLLSIGDRNLLGQVDLEAKTNGMIGIGKLVYIQISPSSLAVSKR